MTAKEVIDYVFNRIELLVSDRKFRHRVNLSTSVKGVHTYDITVEGVGYSMEDIQGEADALADYYDTRYPNRGE